MAVPGHRLDRMFHPKTVVVIGDKGPDYSWLSNNLPFKEKGGALYSVQLDPNEIGGIEKLGVQNFTSLEDVPGEIDYALVAVPRPVAPIILKGLIGVGAHGGGFFTSGFAETGEETGIQLQAQLTAMAKEADFNLVGPNCMGLHLPKFGIRFSADAPVVEEGNIGFMSQSGTHGIMFTLVANRNGMNVNHTVSLGNAIVLDIPDYLDYMAEDDEVDVIGIYIEGMKDGRRFFESLRAACAKKPVVVWKGGRTSAGSRATMSHTGSLATAQNIWDGMIRQCGAISTRNVEETVDVMKVLTMSKQPVGRRLALLGQTGGHSVSIADSFEEGGFETPRFTDATYAELGEFFNTIGGSFQNPLDMAGTIQGKAETLERILSLVEADDNVDGIVLETLTLFASRWRKNPEMLTGIVEAMRKHAERTTKAFIVIAPPGHEPEYVASIQPQFNEARLPTFPSFERGALALDRAAKFARV